MHAPNLACLDFSVKVVRHTNELYSVENFAGGEKVKIPTPSAPLRVGSNLARRRRGQDGARGYSEWRRCLRNWMSIPNTGPYTLMP